jgi:hypothetical protein
MSRYLETETYSQGGNWLMGTARRNPEALLLLAAGCVLLMRVGGSSAKASSRTRYEDDYSMQPAASPPRGSNIREDLSRAAETATEYATELKERISETASSYADSVSDYAEDVRRKVSEHAERFTRQAQSTMQSSVNRVLREQPLALVVAGLAAGAAVAALLPRTEIENRTLGGARDALTDAASKAGETLMGAAGEAGEQLKSAAEERGLRSEGVKSLAEEVVDRFTDAVSGKPPDQGSAQSAPDSSAPQREATNPKSK